MSLFLLMAPKRTCRPDHSAVSNGIGYIGYGSGSLALFAQCGHPGPQNINLPYQLSINDRYWLWYPDTSSKNSHDDNFIKLFCQLLFLDDMKQSTWTPPAATFPPMATVANQQHEAQDVFHHWTKLARCWKAFHYVLQETVSNCLSGTSFVRLAQGWKTLRFFLAVSTCSLLEAWPTGSRRWKKPRVKWPEKFT